MKNEFRKPESKNEAKKKEPRSSSSSSKSLSFDSLKNGFSGKKFPQVIGFVLLLFAVILAIAFCSHLLAWRHDQSEIMRYSAWEYLTSEVFAGNWLGRLGALVSHHFMFSGFGVASFIWCYLLFMTGARLVFSDLNFSLYKHYEQSFIFIVLISVSFGFVFGNILETDLELMGGAFGLYVSKWTIGFIGNVGTGLLLGFLWFLVIVLKFDLEFTVPGFAKKKEDALADNLEEESDLKPIGVIRTEGRPKENTLIPQEEEKSPFADKVVHALDFEVDGMDDEEEELVEEKEPELDFDIIRPVEEVAVSETELEVKPIINENIVEDAENALAHLPPYDPTLDLSSYKYPTLDLLVEYGEGKLKPDTEELQRNKDQIIQTLGHYKIDIDKIRATIGPTVTLYEIIPAAGVRISKIKNLEDDIALSLSALGIRIIAPMPGKGTIGIEVPNKNKETVSMRSLLSSEKFIDSKYDLPIALGRTISNEIFIADLAKMPHLLMAGATGQGKSVGLNAILVSLLYKKHPSELKFVMIDPKRVELTLYQIIERHFLAKLPGEDEAIITDTTRVVNTLNSLCVEMDKRYTLLQTAFVRNLTEYNEKFKARKLNPNDGHKFLPYIVLVIDEFADLMMTAGKEVELPIARIAQLARAVGIHLIIATQRPSVNIITGTIKANFPARLAFKVATRIDSRTILDTGGAEQLIGKGDMLISNGSELTRIQCAFVDTPEVKSICEFIGSQRGYASAFLLPEPEDPEGSVGGVTADLSERDKLFDDAARIIVLSQQGSTSLLQRKLKLGYNRAGRLIDQLELAGVVGPFEGSKAREVRVRTEEELERLLNELNQRDN